jgi:hypothetical protein
MWLHRGILCHRIQWVYTKYIDCNTITHIKINTFTIPWIETIKIMMKLFSTFTQKEGFSIFIGVLRYTFFQFLKKKITFYHSASLTPHCWFNIFKASHYKGTKLHSNRRVDANGEEKKHVTCVEKWSGPNGIEPVNYTHCTRPILRCFGLVPFREEKETFSTSGYA